MGLKVYWVRGLDWGCTSNKLPGGVKSGEYLTGMCEWGVFDWDV